MLRIISVIFLGATLSSIVFARPLSKESGWEFTANVNVAYSSGESQFNTDDENAVTEDLYNSGQPQSNALGYPLLRLQYTLESLNTQFYLGNSREQLATAQFQYEFGIVHKFNDKSKLTFAFFPEYSFLNETWADPFLEGSARKITEENTAGARIAIERFFGGPLTLKYAIASSHIEDELSGQSQLSEQNDIALLRRDSFYHKVEVETMFPISKGMFLKPNFQYMMRNAEGNANSYQQYTGQLSFLMFREKHFLLTAFKAGVRNYQQVNPIFNDKQDLKQTSIFSIYTYKKPFNWQRWSLTLMAAYKLERSNIIFYNSHGLIVSTGVTFQY